MVDGVKERIDLGPQAVICNDAAHRRDAQRQHEGKQAEGYQELVQAVARGI
jgi:hypothetical protein